MELLRNFKPLSTPSTAIMTGITALMVIFYISQAISHSELVIQTLTKAVGLGSTYAIVALGFVLIFKGTQVVNFAQGTLAMAGALFVSFAVNDGNIPLTNIDNPLLSIGPSWMGWS
ncbi:MAG: hypothetical protein AB8G14_18125, partial [Ilumatobacter sp.]